MPRTEVDLRPFGSVLILLSLALPQTGLAAPFRWGIEAGLNRSDLRTTSTLQVKPRTLPAFGLIAERPVSDRWRLCASVRYTQQGERSTWTRPDGTFGSEESREHTLSCGGGAEIGLARPLFVSVSPELTYLLAGSLSGTARLTSFPITYHDEYASRSDRWNATIRVGVGSRWAVGGGAGLLQLRYARGINDMTRITPSVLDQTQRNVAWYASSPPLTATEWRHQGVELIAGFVW